MTSWIRKQRKLQEGLLLYGQLQEGFHLGILRSACVLGAMSYKELCTAAKNEEQSQNLIAKLKQVS